MAKGNFTKFWDSQSNMFWFSYETLVAFKQPGKDVIVHTNDWGNTTGKHLNQIDGGGANSRRDRLSKLQFEKAYYLAFSNEAKNGSVSAIYTQIERLG